MRQYELVVILEPKEESRDSWEKVKELVRKTGKILKEEDWGKKALAYPLKGLREGNFRQIDFEAAAAGVAEMEKKLRQMEEVKRFLMVVNEKKGVRKNGQ
jgi:small subunit ribosomal protein S6